MPSSSAESSLLVSCWTLFRVTLIRHVRSRQTLVALGLTILCLLIVWAFTQHRGTPTVKRFAEQFLIPTFVAFLVPIFAVGYGAAAFGSDREDRSLIYLLMLPVARPWLYLVKLLTTQLVVVTGAMLALGGLCLMAGTPGREAWPIFWPASVLAATTYTSLFVLLGACFRHGTIISLAYWFFLEVMFGNLPGIINRLSVAFYVRSIVYDFGAKYDLTPMVRAEARQLYQPITGSTAMLTLGVASVFLAILGAMIFSGREYRDLS